MLFNNITQGITALSDSEFIDGKMDIKLNDNACFFLHEIAGKLNDPQIPKGLFTLLYIDEQFIISDVMLRNANGLRLKKTESNSLGNKVNPDFIKTLKKITAAYLTNLASNWNLNEEGLSLTHKVKAHNTLKSMGACHTILRQIRELRRMDENLQIEKTESETFVEGQLKYVKEFLEILTEEAIEAKALTL